MTTSTDADPATATLSIYELADVLGRTPTRTVVKPMAQMEAVGPNGPETVETGLVRLELPLPGYLYIRESSYARVADQSRQVSFSKATSFIRRREDPTAAIILDESGLEVPASGLCELLDDLPFLQTFDMKAFESCQQPGS